MSGQYSSRNTREAITSRLRLRGHDYREPGPYFVTICAQNRQCLFGSIQSGELTMFDGGKMVAAQWERLPEQFPSVIPGDHVVMPNHIHGIVTLSAHEDGRLRENGPVLSDVIHWFKGRTFHAYSHGVKNNGWRPYEGRLWQQGYMDHIIRNDREMERLQRYIEVNVTHWEDDSFHPAAVRR